ncbi:hypothetical protein GINT2_001402 [Glugoides intestinalis]
METTQEIEQLFQNCKDKSYIKSNVNELKAYFSPSQNLNALKVALTTNRNFTALKIIEQLNLKIIPYIHINKFTFVSIFWLNRMKVIPEDEFEALCRKFEILNNFDVLYEETEKNFILLQIEKRRRLLQKRKRPCNMNIDVHQYFKPCEEMTFAFILDDVIDIEKYISGFEDFTRYVFWTDLKTFEVFPDDFNRRNKIHQFKEVKMKLGTCSLKSFSKFHTLDGAVQDKLEDLMRAVNKARKAGYRYYMCSYRPLPAALTFCYLFMNNIDLTKIVEITGSNDLHFPAHGRRMVFGNGGNLGYAYLETVMENLRYNFNWNR